MRQLRLIREGRVTWKAALAIAVCSLALLGAIARASAGTAAGCRPGLETIEGVRAFVVCGPAKAVVRLGGRTFTFRNGRCRGSRRHFVVEIGTSGLSRVPSIPSFAITVPAARDGTYTKALIVWSAGRALYGLQNPRLTLSGNRTKGTFTGTAVRRDVSQLSKASGSFTC